MLAMIEDDLAQLGIRHDVFFSERSLSEGPRDEVAETIADLKAKGLIYKGRLPPPKGKVDEDWEDREQLLFRSDRVRRRHRPAAREVRRLLHLFRRRHRLSPRQVQTRLQHHDRRAAAPTIAAISSA